VKPLLIQKTDFQYYFTAGNGMKFATSQSLLYHCSDSKKLTKLNETHLPQMKITVMGRTYF